MQIPCLGGVTKFLVVVGPAPAGVLYAGLQIIKMDHFMKNGSRHVFYGSVEGSRSDIQFMALSAVRPLPCLSHGDMPVGPGGTLDGNNGFLDNPAEIMLI